MNTDTLQTVVDSVTTASEHAISHHNVWMWITIAEAVVIILLMITRSRKERFDPVKEARQKVKAEGKIDFNNTINSAFHANDLYHELIVKCHPDRFVTDEKKHAIAEELSGRIGECKTDYNKLVELREEAKEKLNINY